MASGFQVLASQERMFTRMQKVEYIYIYIYIHIYIYTYTHIYIYIEAQQGYSWKSGEQLPHPSCPRFAKGPGKPP